MTLMDAERWRRIHDLFEAAITRSAGSRQAFLHEACGDQRDVLSFSTSV
jgi:hypothetical protein